MPGGVIESPVEVALAGEDGADVAAPHGDDDIAGLDGVSGEDLGFLVGEVDAFFAHGFDDDMVDGVGRGRSGGADFDGVAGEVGEVAGGHLGAAGVVDADEQDTGLVRHGVHPWWSAGRSSSGSSSLSSLTEMQKIEPRGDVSPGEEI